LRSSWSMTLPALTSARNWLTTATIASRDTP
jgi:hypothetical protein